MKIKFIVMGLFLGIMFETVVWERKVHNMVQIFRVINLKINTAYLI